MNGVQSKKKSNTMSLILLGMSCAILGRPFGKAIGDGYNELNPKTEVLKGTVVSKGPIQRNPAGLYELTLNTNKAQRCTLNGTTIPATAQVTVHGESAEKLPNVEVGDTVNVVNSGEEGRCFSNGPSLPIVVVEGPSSRLQVTKEGDGGN